MKGSIRCSQCDLVNWASEIRCKRCGFSFRPQEADAGIENETVSDFSVQTPISAPALLQREHNWKTDHATHRFDGPTYQPKSPNPKAGLALLSIILAIIGLPPFFSFVAMLVGSFFTIAFGSKAFLVGVALVFAVIPSGLVTGIVALRRARRRPNEYAGKGYAIAAIVCSSLGFLAIAIALPNLMASQRAANEERAISTMRTLAEIEAKLSAKVVSKGCVDIRTLAMWNLVDWSMENGNQSGYHFQVVDLPQGGCEILATPISPSTGTRSFYYSTTDGVIREGTKKENRPINTTALGSCFCFGNDKYEQYSMSEM